MRKSLFDYDQVLNTQRDKVYAIRRQALLSNDLSALMLDFSARTMDDILEVIRGSGLTTLALLQQIISKCAAVLAIPLFRSQESICEHNLAPTYGSRVGSTLELTARVM